MEEMRLHDLYCSQPPGGQSRCFGFTSWSCHVIHLYLPSNLKKNRQYAGPCINMTKIEDLTVSCFFLSYWHKVVILSRISYVILPNGGVFFLLSCWQSCRCALTLHNFSCTCFPSGHAVLYRHTELGHYWRWEKCIGQKTQVTLPGDVRDFVHFERARAYGGNVQHSACWAMTLLCHSLTHGH